MRYWMFVGIILASLTVGCSSSDQPSNDSSADADVNGDVDSAVDSGHDAEAGVPGDTDSPPDADANDAGASYPADIAYEAYRSALLELQTSIACEIAWSCHTQSAYGTASAARFASKQQCTAVLGDSPVNTARWDTQTANIERLIDAQRIAFDSERAAACLNYLASRTTDELCDPQTLSGAQSPCNESPLTGTIGSFEACIANEECAGNARCARIADECRRECRTNHIECGHNTCDDDEYCADAEFGTCASKEAEGVQCTGDDQCSGGLNCMILEGDTTGTCLSRASRAEGQSCSDDMFCASDDHCVDETCVPIDVIEAGQACSDGDLCVAGTVCRVASIDDVVGTCEAPGEIGDVCRTSLTCKWGLYCDNSTDDHLGQCSVAKPDGSDCNSADNCESGQFYNNICGDSAPVCDIPS